MAERIKLIARENQIEIVSLPVLARAIYYTTELNDEIPEPLYLAVAQVLSYVFALNDEIYSKSDLATPNPEVPSEYQYDQDGNQLVN
jgi:flagellar biosynthetic protein FlhB